MHLAITDWLILFLYLFLLLWLGFRLSRVSRRDEEEYLLDGRRLTLPAFVATTVSTWYGGILGVGEYSYNYGISNWVVFGLPYYLAAFIFALFIAGRAQRSRLLSIPDQLNAAYGKPVAIIGAVIVFIMTVPAAYILMLGVLFSLLFGWNILVGVVVAAIISTIYVLLGGFRSLIRTDGLQFILMFGGFVILVVFLTTQVGGWNYLISNLPVEHFSLTGGRSRWYILSWYFIALAALVEPAFYQRAFAAASVQTARNGFLISILFWFLFDMLTTVSGLFARALLGDGIRGVDAFPLLGDKILPAGVKGLFFIGMIATIQSTIDSYSFIAAGTFGRDIIWRFKRVAGRLSQVDLTRIGLAFSTLLAVVIALTTDSVVDIWHRLGSLGTPALLLPLALSYNSRLKFRPGWAAMNLILTPLLVGIWFIIRSLPAPAGGPLWKVQPIFVGLSLSLLILAADHISRRYNKKGDIKQV